MKKKVFFCQRRPKKKVKKHVHTDILFDCGILSNESFLFKDIPHTTVAEKAKKQKTLRSFNILGFFNGSLGCGFEEICTRFGG